MLNGEVRVRRNHCFSVEKENADIIFGILKQWKNREMNISREICAAIMYWDTQMYGNTQGRNWPRINEAPYDYLAMWKAGQITNVEIYQMRDKVIEHTKVFNRILERLKGTSSYEQYMRLR